MGRVHLLTHSFLDGYNRDFGKIFGGGIERYMADLCGLLIRMGERPVVHQLSYFEPFRTSRDGIEVIGYPYEFDRVPEAFDRMSEATGDEPLIYASCIWHPLRYRRGSLGICHGINWDRPELAAEAKRDVAAAVQSALHGLERIVSVDSHFQTYCRSVCTYDGADRIVRIPNAVDTARFAPASAHTRARARRAGGTRDDEPTGRAHSDAGGGRRASRRSGRPLRLLYPRRLSRERGIVPTMLLADDWLRTYPALEVEFAGEIVHGSAIGDAFELWRASHLHRDRILHRVYNFEHMPDAYRGADIAIIPTMFSEGTSYSCLEAMSCGLAVVATDVGGLNDLVTDGFNGLLVPPDRQALDEAVRQLIGNAELRTRLGRQARETALAFDIAIWEKRWRRVLDGYLDRCRSGSTATSHSSPAADGA